MRKSWSLVVMLAGAISVRSLSIAQYPQVTPPTVQVDCNFPGADSRTVSDTIASPIVINPHLYNKMPFDPMKDLVPVAGLALILGIDRFMSEARALTNLVGNGVATLVVAKWTGDLDVQRLQAGLNHPTAQEAQDPEAILDLQESHMAVTPAQR